MAPISQLIQDRQSNNPVFPDVLVELLLTINAAFLVELFLYGTHTILFFICVYILIMRKGSAAQIIVLGSAIVMFGLATADIFLSFRFLAHDLRFLFIGRMDLLDGRIAAKNHIYVAANFVADLLLCHRAYVIWAKQKWILYVGSILILADTVWGFLAITTNKPGFTLMFAHVYLWSIFGVNVTLTIVTAGRIAWVSRMGNTLLPRYQIRAYRVVVAILVESGLIYSACILLFVLPRDEKVQTIACAILMRVVGIVPTLMIVQVALSRLSTRIDTTASHGHEPTSIILDTIVSVVNDSHHAEEFQDSPSQRYVNFVRAAASSSNSKISDSHPNNADASGVILNRNLQVSYIPKENNI